MLETRPPHAGLACSAAGLVVAILGDCKASSGIGLAASRKPSHGSRVHRRRRSGDHADDERARIEARPIRKGRHKPTPWLAALLRRKPPKLVAMALATSSRASPGA